VYRLGHLPLSLFDPAADWDPGSMKNLDASDGDPTDPLPREPWTELGYAHRLVHVYGDRLR
jgi:hypothetical protein